VRSNVDPMWHLYPIFVSDKPKVFKNLRGSGVGVQVNYVPAYQHPVFARNGIKSGLFKNSEKFYEEEISLPIYSGLNEEKLSTIVDAVCNSL